MTCTNDSHATDKASRAPHLVFHGVQEDEDGQPALVLIRCCRCESTLAVRVDGDATW